MPTSFTRCFPSSSLEGLLDRIADALTALIPYDDMHVYEVDDGETGDGRSARPLTLGGAGAGRRAFPFGEGITGWAVEHREPVLANQADLDPRVRIVAEPLPSPSR